ncbi:MAG: hypothetical protein ACK43N_25785, partial [Pirellulaceae bacterium]
VRAHALHLVAYLRRVVFLHHEILRAVVVDRQGGVPLVVGPVRPLAPRCLMLPAIPLFSSSLLPPGWNR